MRPLALAPLALALLPALAFAQPKEADRKPTFGHSMQGPVFDTGPRQRAKLLKGMPRIVFPVTTKKRGVREFIEQGVGQLHGFWWLEAERSFRQAAALDPDCAMAYWGMAMARMDYFPDQAKQLSAKAMEKRAGASERERLWIEALDGLLQAKMESVEERKAASGEYVRKLEAMAARWPNDIEIKAFLAHSLLWGFEMLGRKREEVDSLMRQVLAADPNHPIHHYRIHLWDAEDKNALDSAASCGQSGPGVAHLWHMQGHIYSGLNRYGEAARSQEASARVDHAYMMRERLLPDEIHNYAHNNQWLAEDLIFVGRTRDALAVSSNLVALPRHPSYNTLPGWSSAAQGRNRLFQTLTEYCLYDEALALDEAGLIEPGTTPELKRGRLHTVGVAAFGTGDVRRGRLALRELEALAGEKPSNEAKQQLAELRGWAALAAGDKPEALARFAESGLSPDQHALALLAAGEAEKAAERVAKADTAKVAPLATKVLALWGAGKRTEATEAFTALRSLAGRADIDQGLLARLAPIAQALKWPDDWRTPAAPTADERRWRQIERLGPLTYSPPVAPSLALPQADGKKVSLADFTRAGKPVLVVFFLGAACERCVAQLNALKPALGDLEKLGVSVVAVSTDDRTALKNEQGKWPFPLLADPDGKAFRSWRAYDDFEEMPLHGTFLIDGKGRLRWQDIGATPFADVAFLTAEARRLLALPG